MIKNTKKKTISTEKLNAILLSVVTLVIFIITKNPITKVYSLQFTLIAFIAVISYIIMGKRAKRALLPNTTYFLGLVFTLFLIGTTGWSFSPFFFALYFIAISTAFIYDLTATLIFTVTLVVLFSFSIGEIDVAYDFLIVLSLLSVLPLSHYLRKEYLKLKESAKEILVLKEKGNTYESKLEEALANKVSNLSLNIKQPINDTKQLAYMLTQSQTKEERSETIERIITSSDEALRMLRSFEEQTTGENLLRTTNKITK